MRSQIHILMIASLGVAATGQEALEATDDNVAAGLVPAPIVEYDEIVPIQTGVLQVNRWGENGLGPRPPMRWLTPEEEQAIIDWKSRPEDEEDAPVPFDPNFDPASVVPLDPEANPTQPGQRGGVTFYRNHALTDAETGNPGSWPAEPSTGMFGRIGMYCGNTYGAVTTDGGLNWTFLNPNTLFGGGICCDQIMYYDRRHQMMIWLMQGTVSGNENVYKIGIASGIEDIANSNWYWYTLDPQSNLGFPAGTWLDFPSMAVSYDYLYWTTNGQSGSGNSVIVRMPLDELLAGGAVNFQYGQVSFRQNRLINDMTSWMYTGSHVDNNTMRLYRWDEAGGSLNGVSRDVAAWNNGNSFAPGPDGRDWFSGVENATHKVRGAAGAGSNLHFFWTDSQGGGFPFPYIRIARFLRGDARTYEDTNTIWSSTAAWAYSTAHANDRGHLGGVATFGGGDTYHPSSVAWYDDDGNEDISFGISTFMATGDNGPTGDRWGDYQTARIQPQYPNTWVGATFDLQNGPSPTDAVHRIAWFGAAGDAPPANATIYTNASYSSTFEDSSAARPFNTLREAHFFTESGDTIRMVAGNYDEQITLNRPCTIITNGGDVRIGD